MKKKLIFKSVQCFFCLGLLTVLSGNLFSQGRDEKKIVDTAAIRESESWPSIGFHQLSDDGKYALYAVNNLPKGSKTLILQSTENDWKKELPGVSDVIVTKNSRWVLYCRQDTLCIVELGKKGTTILPNVNRFETFDRNGSSWLAYMDGEELVMRELSNAHEERLGTSAGFWASPKKDFLIWKLVNTSGGANTSSLLLMDMGTGIVNNITTPSTVEIDYLAFDPYSGHTLTFFSRDTLQQDKQYSMYWYQTGQKAPTLIWKNKSVPVGYRFDEVGDQLVISLHDTVWYYKEGMPEAIPVITKSKLSLKNEFSLETASFPENGSNRLIKFLVAEKLPEEKKGTGTHVDIWHYRDKDLQSEQALPQYVSRKKYENKMYWMIFNLDSNKIYCISDPEDGSEHGSGKHYKLVEKKLDFTKWWHISDKRGFNLISLDNGSRQLLPIDGRYNNPVATLSPHEDYVVYFDPMTKDYWSYEISTRKTINLTKGTNVSWERGKYDHYFTAPNPFFGRSPLPRDIAGWVDGDNSVLLYDSYDIWKVDPAGRQAPVNMTEGYGRANHIVFELDVTQNDMKHLSSKDEWILKAVNKESRYQGFFRKNPGIKSAPEKLVMATCEWEIRAKSTEGTSTYIVNKSSAAAPWDLYVTMDFRLMKPLYSVKPQKQYRWYTTEVVRWRLPDGDSCTGILYKPDDLDPKKKYPIIFNYYQQEPYIADKFIKPELTRSANIDVPYWVSRGYLVFMPGIHYKIGHPGEGALQSVESAAKYLMKRSYVDGKHMGLSGHSWGGYETNYIVTHSNLFAAAAEGAGPTDFVSGYGAISGLNGLGGGNYFQYEFSQSRMGATLWDSTSLYLENSPIFQANKTTTPLLMLHNKLDDAVLWSQGVELMIALWRLSKPAWMLQYDGEGHSLTKEENKIDYTIRLTQFFDHYLKDAPAPKWMVDGIPFSNKGIDSGYELMPEKTP